MRIKPLGCVEMCDVADCVDTRVGTPGTRHGDGCMEQGGQRLLKRLLDARSIRLDLPPAEIRAAVGELDRITHKRMQN